MCSSYCVLAEYLFLSVAFCSSGLRRWELEKEAAPDKNIENCLVVVGMFNGNGVASGVAPVIMVGHRRHQVSRH